MRHWRRVDKYDRALDDLRKLLECCMRQWYEEAIKVPKVLQRWENLFASLQEKHALEDKRWAEKQALDALIDQIRIQVNVLFAGCVQWQ